MRLDESLHYRIENLLVEARQARDPATNGLMDRTDCLDLIARLGAATQTLLNLAVEMQHERAGQNARSAKFIHPVLSASRELALTDPDRHAVRTVPDSEGWRAPF